MSGSAILCKMSSKSQRSKVKVTTRRNMVKRRGIHVGDSPSYFLMDIFELC